MTNIAEFMKARRSALSLTLEEPGPNASQLNDIVEIASRVPDHGKLTPWRFELWSKTARQKMHSQLSNLLASRSDFDDQPKKQKGTDKLLHAPCVLAVISTATDHEKVPSWEQKLSAGAACMNTLIATNALGFEAQWLTAWYVYEDDAKSILRLKADERIAGIIHIGSSTTPKNERPRPQIQDIFQIRES